MIAFGDGAEELPDEIWDEVERGRPSELTVMKDVSSVFNSTDALRSFLFI